MSYHPHNMLKKIPSYAKTSGSSVLATLEKEVAKGLVPQANAILRGFDRKTTLPELRSQGNKGHTHLNPERHHQEEHSAAA